MELHYFVNTKK